MRVQVGWCEEEIGLGGHWGALAPPTEQFPIEHGFPAKLDEVTASIAPAVDEIHLAEAPPEIPDSVGVVSSPPETPKTSVALLPSPVSSASDDGDNPLLQNLDLLLATLGDTNAPSLTGAGRDANVDQTLDRLNIPEEPNDAYPGVDTSALDTLTLLLEG